MSDLFALSERPVRDVQAAIEEEVTNANITINEGIGASQYGIGIVSARLAEAVLRDEGAVSPVSAHQPDYGVSLSVPAVLGRSGLKRTLPPRMIADERAALGRSADTLRDALRGLSSWRSLPTFRRLSLPRLTRFSARSRIVR